MADDLTVNHRPVHPQISGDAGLRKASPLVFFCKRLLKLTPDGRDKSASHPLTRGSRHSK